MEKIDLGQIKFTHRIVNGVEQRVKLYNREQKRLIIEIVTNKPDSMTIEDVLKLYEIQPAVYYTWVRKVGVKDTHNGKVKNSKWVIEVECENEAKAVKYLTSLITAFEISGEINLPMDLMVMENYGEKIICTKIR